MRGTVLYRVSSMDMKSVDNLMHAQIEKQWIPLSLSPGIYFASLHVTIVSCIEYLCRWGDDLIMVINGYCSSLH